MPMPSSPDTTSDVEREPIADLDHDHDDLIALLHDLGALVQQAAVDATRERALQQARQLMRYFCEDMASHFRLEEERLFPALRKELPERRGAVDALAQAHERFTQLVDEVRHKVLDDQVSEATLGSCHQSLSRLIESFRSHSQAECELVHAMDAAVSDPARRRELRELLGGI